MNNSINTPNINFTSRCLTIRDAQWVSRQVHSYPHISCSKIGKTLRRLVRKANLDGTVTPEKEKMFDKLFDWRDKMVAYLGSVRRSRHTVSAGDDYTIVKNILKQFKKDGVGNCGEDAHVAAAILQINGVKNAYVADIKANGIPIDHSVCIFNKDGSLFDGKVTKNTVIIDPWVGDADFARNMFVKYKNEYKSLLDCGMRGDAKFSFRKIKKMNLDEIDQLYLFSNNQHFYYPNRELFKTKPLDVKA